MHEQRRNLIHYIIPALLGNISMFILTIVDGKCLPQLGA